jgi:hypothetical protein
LDRAPTELKVYLGLITINTKLASMTLIVEEE